MELKDSPQKTNNIFLCGALASCTNVLIVYPFHKMVFYQQLNGISFYKAILTIHDQGISRVYRGLLPPLLQRGCTVSIMFGTQNKVEKLVLEMAPKNVSDYSCIISSIAAGLCEATLLPFERIQTILQNPKYNQIYKNTFDAFQLIRRHYGFKELYRGYQPILIRNSLGNSLYFSGRSYFQKSEDFIKIKNENLRNFLSGGFMGACIGICTFPLNVMKAKMQSEIGVSTNIYPTFVSLFNESRRINRFYSGVPANFVRSIVSWGIITMVFEFLIKFT